MRVELNVRYDTIKMHTYPEACNAHTKPGDAGWRVLAGKQECVFGLIILQRENNTIMIYKSLAKHINVLVTLI